MRQGRNFNYKDRRAASRWIIGTIAFGRFAPGGANEEFVLKGGPASDPQSSKPCSRRPLPLAKATAVLGVRVVRGKRNRSRFFKKGKRGSMAGINGYGWPRNGGAFAVAARLTKTFDRRLQPCHGLRRLLRESRSVTYLWHLYSSREPLRRGLAKGTSGKTGRWVAAVSLRRPEKVAEAAPKIPCQYCEPCPPFLAESVFCALVMGR